MSQIVIREYFKLWDVRVIKWVPLERNIKRQLIFLSLEICVATFLEKNISLYIHHCVGYPNNLSGIISAEIICFTSNGGNLNLSRFYDLVFSHNSQHPWSRLLMSLYSVFMNNLIKADVNHDVWGHMTKQRGSVTCNVLISG